MRIRLALPTAALAASLAAAPLQAEQALPQSVQDLRYGATLYHYYQQDYFAALTELMVAQQLKALPNHGDGAELLRGGMSLSYGLDRQAGQIFNQLLQAPHQGVDRDRAWFYLGKMAWRRGDNGAASTALARVELDYAGTVADEANYLRAMLALQLGDEQAAVGHVARIDNLCPWQPYYYYNLGARRAALGDWAGAVSAYREAGQVDCRGEEARALRDKAFTAAGFAQLGQADPEAAAGDFVQVRLDGPESARALLGYGWSAGNRGDYLAALSPWQVLGQRPMASPAARESLLAIPWAYEQLERPGLALQGYEYAARRYQQDLERLQQLITAVGQGDVLALFGIESAVAQDWLGGEDILPLGEHAPYLRQLLASDRAQLALREIRDLDAIRRELALAQERLEVLRQVDADQQSTWAEVIEGDRRQQLQQRQSALEGAAGELRTTLRAAREPGAERLLADAAQSARWQRVERAVRLAGTSAGKPQQREQLRLMRGLLIWQDSEDFPDRLWRTERHLADIDQLLADNRAGLARVDAAITGRDAASFLARIEVLEQRVEQQSGEVALALNLAADTMRQLALEDLQQQERLLVQSLGQSRLAVARLYDRASTGVSR